MSLNKVAVEYRLREFSETGAHSTGPRIGETGNVYVFDTLVNLDTWLQKFAAPGCTYEMTTAYRVSEHT